MIQLLVFPPLLTWYFYRRVLPIIFLTSYVSAIVFLYVTLCEHCNVPSYDIKLMLLVAASVIVIHSVLLSVCVFGSKFEKKLFHYQVPLLYWPLLFHVPIHVCLKNYSPVLVYAVASSLVIFLTGVGLFCSRVLVYRVGKFFSLCIGVYAFSTMIVTGRFGAGAPLLVPYGFALLMSFGDGVHSLYRYLLGRGDATNEQKGFDAAVDLGGDFGAEIPSLCGSQGIGLNN